MMSPELELEAERKHRGDAPDLLVRVNNLETTVQAMDEALRNFANSHNALVQACRKMEQMLLQRTPEHGIPPKTTKGGILMP